jgi:hypothetical protein
MGPALKRAHHERRETTLCVFSGHFSARRRLAPVLLRCLYEDNTPQLNVGDDRFTRSFGLRLSLGSGGG